MAERIGRWSRKRGEYLRGTLLSGEKPNEILVNKDVNRWFLVVENGKIVGSNRNSLNVHTSGTTILN